MPAHLNNEIRRLRQILGNPPRSPKQKNSLNQSDAEIIRVSEGYLVATTDLISDEIHWGLYKSAELVGWMSVVASLSDLAVTGAKPLGVLLGTHWGPDFDEKRKVEFFKGANAALKKHDTFLLGGDTSSGGETVISCTALGVIPQKQKPLLRTKIAPGDEIYACGQFGPGPALGLRVLSQLEDRHFPEKRFRPQVSFLKSPKNISAAIDVSDGLASSLCILSELNHISFDIEIPEDLFGEREKAFCRSQGFPLLSLFFAEHGDYQPLYAVKPSQKRAFLRGFPEAQRIATARKGSWTHRIKNRHSEWKNLQLDLIFNADKSDLQQLQDLFKKWIAKVKADHLA